METVIKQTGKTQAFKDKANKVMGISLEDAKITKSYLSVAFLAILLGGILGLLQGLNRAGMLELPAWLNYYQVLTAHGLLLVVVLSAFFTIGYFYAGLSHTLGGLLPKVRKMAWIGFWMKIFGFVLAVIPILMNEASVMYTFYPPMAASPIFYIGLVFIVLGVWMYGCAPLVPLLMWLAGERGIPASISLFFLSLQPVYLFSYSLEAYL